MRKFLLAGALLILLVTGGIWLARQNHAPRPAPSPPPIETIESSGEIFGLAIGSNINAAREKLDPLRVPVKYTPDEKEKSGRRIYWKLKETDVDWIMAWADAEGKITRVRAVFRPETTKPFHEIGDLKTAASATETAVKWNLQRSDGTRYRLIAQGEAQKAKTVYMFALPRFAEDGPEPEPDEEE